MNSIQHSIRPALRGALFYSAYWGVVGMYEPFINLYFLDLGLTGTQIGWLAAVLPLCTLIVAPLVTRLADLTQRRAALLAASCLGFGLALALFALPGLRPGFPLLVGMIALISVFRGPVISLADSLIAPMAVRHNLNFGAMRLWGSVIFTVSASALGLIWERAGFQAMFLSAAAGFLPVALAARLLEEREKKPVSPTLPSRFEEGRAERGFTTNPSPANPLRHKSPLLAAEMGGTGASEGSGLFTSREQEKEPGRESGLPPRIDPGLWFLLAATFLVIAALFMGMNFGTVYMSQMGGPAMLVGMVMGISALFEAPGMLYGASLTRRWGSTNMLLLAYALNGAGLFGYGISETPLTLLIFSAVRGLGFGLMLVGNVTIINQHAPPHYISTFLGVFNAACYGLAPLLGGPVSGWIYQTYGPPALFFTTAAMTALGALIILPTYAIWGKGSRGAIR